MARTDGLEIKVSTTARQAMRDLDKLAAKARDMIRVDYECARGCDTRYPEHVVKREREPCCGRCGGPLVRLTMVVVDRDD